MQSVRWITENIKNTNLLEKAASQCGHRYFLSPVCSLTWRSRLLLCLKSRWQKSHLNGIWSLWLCCCWKEREEIIKLLNYKTPSSSSFLHYTLFSTTASTNISVLLLWSHIVKFHSCLVSNFTPHSSCVYLCYSGFSLYLKCGRKSTVKTRDSLQGQLSRRFFLYKCQLSHSWSRWWSPSLI